MGNVTNLLQNNTYFPIRDNPRFDSNQTTTKSSNKIREFNMSTKRNRQSGKVEATKRKSLNPNNIQYNYFTEKLIIALKNNIFYI